MVLAPAPRASPRGTEPGRNYFGSELIFLDKDELLSWCAAARALGRRLLALDVMATAHALPDDGHPAADRRLVLDDGIQHSDGAGFYGYLR